MPVSLPLVLFCELAERLIALRDLVTEPIVSTKDHTRAVAALIAQGLDLVERQVQSDVQRWLTAAEGETAGDAVAVRRTVAAMQALGVLHHALEQVELRWSVASIDIFLRKLRDESPDLPHATVVLTDRYELPDRAVAEHLHGALAAVGFALHTPSAGGPIVALPRIESANPLAWPLLLPVLVRLADHAHRHSPSLEGALPARVAVLGGPAAFAARAVAMLLLSPLDRPLWPELAPLAAATQLAAPTETTILALFSTLIRRRDTVLEVATRDDGASIGAVIEGQGVVVALPDAAGLSALLAKLTDGIPINALEPSLPPDIVTRLEEVGDAEAFYALIEPLNERPASLATITAVGWLYKLRDGYPLFGTALERGGFGAALAAYRPHLVARNALLLQSIEAAHVQDIFVRGRLAE